MLGCVGVAPAGDFAPTSSPSGPYGGNLDYNEIGEGSTVILPVYHAGALLFIGDGHALQGDGEPTGTGIETSMAVEFAVELRKKATLSGPRVETSEYIISVGSQPEFASSTNRAVQMATSDMVNWLTSEYKMEPWAAHLLIGYQGRYDIVTVAGSVGLKIPKKQLPSQRLVRLAAAVLGSRCWGSEVLVLGSGFQVRSQMCEPEPGIPEPAPQNPRTQNG